MKRIRDASVRWGPPIFLMLVIFALSSRPATELPNFGWADYVVKKGSHMIGFGLLSMAYWGALGRIPRRKGLAWLLAVLYAATDELHQSLVPGRHSSLFDVLIFDGGGAGMALWLLQLLPTRRS